LVERSAVRALRIERASAIRNLFSMTRDRLRGRALLCFG
jgi:hypothetical protein